MSGAVAKLERGSNVVVLWDQNRINPNTVQSNKTTIGKTEKVMLISPKYKGPLPRPGEPWICQVDDETSKSPYHGKYLLVPVQQQIDYKFPNVWIPEEKAKLIACVLQDPRKNLFMRGDAGVGKSTIAFSIADKLKWEFRKISGGLIKKAVYMLGRYVPHYEDKPIDMASLDEKLLEILMKHKGEQDPSQMVIGAGDKDLIALMLSHMSKASNSLSFKWVDSKLVSVLREAAANPHRKYSAFIDEFPRIDIDARDTLLDVQEGQQRSLRLVTGEEIPVGRNVKFSAAGNLGEGFTVKTSDAAQDDRWEFIHITVMPPAEELAHCLRMYPACPKKQMEIGIKAITKVREARKDASQQISKTVSTRRAESVAMYLASGFNIEIALETAVANQYEGVPEDLNSQAHKVLSILKDAVAELK